MADESDKRLHPRVALVLRIGYGAAAPDAVDWTENVSAGGLFIRTDRTWPIGESLTLHVSFPGLLETVELPVRVGWLRPAAISMPAGVGVNISSDVGHRRLAEIVLTVLRPKVVERGRPFKIVVAEDNPTMTRSFERVLNTLSTVARMQLDVRFAGDGFAALRIIQAEGADLVISDAYMPVLDGFRLVEQVRAMSEYHAMPFIMVTAGDEEEEEAAAKIGVDAFLRKPLQLGELLETIACLVAARALI